MDGCEEEKTRVGVRPFDCGSERNLAPLRVGHLL